MLTLDGCDYCETKDCVVVTFSAATRMSRNICRRCVEKLLAAFKHPNQYTKARKA